MAKNSPLSGYTFVEILVAALIMGVTLSLGAAGFREFSRRQLLVSAARSLQGDLRLAQGYALSGKKPAGCSVLDGYRVTISSSSYSLKAVCAKTAKSINKDNLPIVDGITASTTRDTFTFKALGQGTDMDEGSSSVITLTQTATGKTQTIIVYASGEIK